MEGPVVRMRLAILDRGHRMPARMFFSMTSLLSRVDMSDVPKTLLYRPEFFGRAMLDLSAAAMRGLSYWTAGEREYMAMATAKLLECPYCAVTHEEMVRIATTGEIDPTDANSARPELRVVLTFLERVISDPDKVSSADLHAVREGAVPDEAVAEALRVAVVWNVVNRLANAFDFQLRPGQLEKGTRSLHRFGYRFPGFLTGPAPAGNGQATSNTGDHLVEQLRESVLHGPAVTDAATRTAAANGGSLPEPAASYAANVRDQSYRVTDADIAALTAAGHSEDVIFELTVAAAVGAAMRCYDAGRSAVRACK
jgi:alkylhydroperoxidase family enzyme